MLELHTYSSLNPTFLPEYKNTLEPAEEKYIFIDDHALRIKNLPPISDDSVWNSFNDRNIKIVRKPEELKNKIVNLNRNDLNLLFMSSGNLGGLNIQEIFDKNRQP